MGNTRALAALLLFCCTLHAEYYPWVHRFGGSNAGKAIRLDSAGNAYVAGMFENEITIGTNHFASRGDVDIFITKLSPDGVIQSLRPSRLKRRDAGIERMARGNSTT